MSLRQVNGTRYVAPLREGGSLPAIVEADDGRMYVVKFCGAGQGPLALVAELVSGEIARLLELPVPEIVLVNLESAFGRTEPDAEIRDLLKASTGLNLGLEYLAEAATFDAVAGDAVPGALASLIVWFDALVLNVDRTTRNANLMVLHDQLWLIDHGASLYFHHNWAAAHPQMMSKLFLDSIANHVLLRWAEDVEGASRIGRDRLTEARLTAILDLVPDQWLETGEATAAERREAYRDFLLRRLAASSIFEKEIARARSHIV